MIDQLVASKGRTFVGAYFSTFTGYINRLRGYHAYTPKKKEEEEDPNHSSSSREDPRDGGLNSYYYTPLATKYDMRVYKAVQEPMWAREFPIAWRDIDHDVVME